MTRDDHVREREQAREHVVLDDPRGKVLEEEVGFLLVHVEAEVADPPGLQAGDDGFRVDQLPAARVDEHHALLHLPHGLGVDQVMRLGHQGAVEGDDVGARVDVGQRGVVGAELFQFGVAGPVVSQDTAVEPHHDLRHDRADLAGADHADCVAVEVETQQAVQREVAFADARVGLVDLSIQGEHQADRVFSDSVRRIGGHANDG